MKTQLALITLFALLLSSCAVAPMLVAPGVANGLYYGIKNPVTRSKVACEIKAVAVPLQTLASVPDTAQFDVLLERYLPNNDVKEITKLNVVSSYAVLYPVIKDKAQATQLEQFKLYLNGLIGGASVYCP